MNRTFLAGFGLAIGLAASAPIHGDLLGFDLELHAQVEIDDEAWDVYRLYVLVSEPDDMLWQVGGVHPFGGACIATDGEFYQHPQGLDIEHPGSLEDVYPDLEWDTYVSIGSTNSDVLASTVLVNWSGFEEDGLFLCGAVWKTDVPIYPDDEGRIFAGQFTVREGAELGGENLYIGGPTGNNCGNSFGDDADCDDDISDDCDGECEDDDDLEGVASDGRFGAAIVCLGDINDDGFDEIAVGSYKACFGRGRVAIHRTDGQFVTQFFGLDEGEHFGYSLANAGDVNGDGVDDLAIGSPRANKLWYFAHGRVDVFCPVTGQLLVRAYGDERLDQLGWSITGGGDIDGDGVPDLVAGAPFNDEHGNKSGMISVVSGATSEIIRREYGAKKGDRFGYSVAMLPREDMRARFAVGAPWQDPLGKGNAGRVYVYGPNANGTAYRLNGKQAGERFGTSMACIPDIDDDGRDDLAIAAPFYDYIGSNRGRFRLVSGADGTKLYQRRGHRPASHYGRHLAAIGDVDGDGVCDISVGAPRHDGPEGPRSGLLQILSSDDGSSFRVYTGAAANDRFGSASALLGDIDDDGCLDFICGAPRAGFETCGEAQVAYGCDPEEAFAGWMPPGRPGTPDIADADANGIVDEADLAMVLGGAGQADALESDLDGDGMVTGLDVALVLTRFGHSTVRRSSAITESVDDEDDEEELVP